MKKILSLVMIMLTVAMAAKADSLDDARRREREARDRMNGPGYLVPGGPRPGNPYPGNPYPGNPYPGNPGNVYPGNPYPQNPYPSPGYSDVYGPGRTVRWQDMGSHRAEKFVDRTIVLRANGQFVNELFIVAQNNHVTIRSAIARLTNGQIVDLRYLVGTVRDGQQLRQQLDYRSSLRVDSIELNIEAGNLIGSRGSLNVQLGLAF